MPLAGEELIGFFHSSRSPTDPDRPSGGVGCLFWCPRAGRGIGSVGAHSGPLAPPRVCRDLGVVVAALSVVRGSAGCLPVAPVNDVLEFNAQLLREYRVVVAEICCEVELFAIVRSRSVSISALTLLLRKTGEQCARHPWGQVGEPSFVVCAHALSGWSLAPTDHSQRQGRQPLVEVGTH